LYKIKIKMSYDLDLNEEKTIKKTLEYNFYIKRDYPKSKQLTEQLFVKLRNPNDKNKHKCNRNKNCGCVYLGRFLIDIYLNTNTEKPDLMKFLEDYYILPGINLPVILFKHVCKSLLKLLDYRKVRSLIENYLSYSTVQGAKTGNISTVKLYIFIIIFI
jgi:hypothetical protein